MQGEGETLFKRKKINRGDSEYVDAKLTAHEQDTEIVGYGALERFQRAISRMTTDAITRTEQEKDTLWDTLEPDRSVLLDNLKNNPNCQAAVANLLSRAVMAPHISKYLYRNPDLAEVEEFARSIREKTFDLDVFVSILAMHVRETEAAVGKLEMLIPRWQQELIESTEQAIKNGFLPSDTDVEEIKQRLHETKIIGKDPFRHGDHAIAGSAAAFVIRIDLSARERNQRKTFFHETGHGMISGRNEVTYPISDNEIGYALRKSGVRLYSLKDREHWTSTLGWLDEALTEEIGSYLAGEEPESYPEERKLLQELKDAGIPWNVFTEAYQENYNDGPKGAQKLPKMKELYRQIYLHRSRVWVREQDKAFEARQHEATE